MVRKGTLPPFGDCILSLCTCTRAIAKRCAIPFHVPFFPSPLIFFHFAVITLPGSLVSRKKLRLTRPCLACGPLPDAEINSRFLHSILQYPTAFIYTTTEIPKRALACLTNRQRSYHHESSIITRAIWKSLPLADRS